MKYPNILYTALLSGILLVPFAIREFAPTLEPYPAVLLPSGGGLIKTADQMDFDRISIYGRVAGRDDWIRLSPSQFLNPVPAEFFLPLAQRYFGLSPIGCLVCERCGLCLLAGGRSNAYPELIHAPTMTRRLYKRSLWPTELRKCRNL